jgi:hypothetical protein
MQSQSASQQASRQSAAQESQASRQSAAQESQASRQSAQSANREDWQSYGQQQQQDRQNYASNQYDNYHSGNTYNYYGGGYYGGAYYAPPPSGAAYAAGVVTGAIIGSTMTAAAFSAQSQSCTKVIVGSVTYYQCGSTWYQPTYQSSKVATRGASLSVGRVAAMGSRLAFEAGFHLLNAGLERGHLLLQFCQITREDLATTALVG